MSNDTPKQPQPAKPGQKADGQVINRSDLHAAPVHAELVEAILSQLEVFFSSKTKELFATADEHFLKTADQAKNFAEKNHVFEFMYALRKQREMISKIFFSELNRFLKPVAICKELPKKQIHKPSGGLSLVAQDEMDEIVALTTIVGKATMECREELAHLEMRLDELSQLNRHIFHSKALDPQHICDAFQEALVTSGFDKRNKLLLYKLFESEVIKHIKTLYSNLNVLLISAGILPQIDHAGKIRRDPRDSRQRTMHRDAPVNEQFSAAQIQGPLGRGGLSGGYYTSPVSGSGSLSGQGMVAEPQGQTAASSHSAAESTATPDGRNDQRFSAGLPVGQIRQSISGFVGGDPVTGDMAGGAVDGAVYYTRQEVVTALSGLQNVIEVSPNAPLQFDASAIKRAVLANIGERSGGAVTKRVNQISEKTIDFIKLIFDAIIEDKGINDTIKALLLSLQIPIIKAAMLDADFFIDDKHPARQLLDRIAEAGVGVSDHKDPVYIELNGIVKTLLKDYSEDIGAFTVALDAIKALTDRLYAQARSTEKQSQEQVKHAHARNVVLQEIRKITLGKELAHGIRILVLKIWPSLMFNHYLRFGKSNDEWVEMLMILAKIIESVQSHMSIAEMEELGLSQEDLIKSVSDKLKKYRKSEAVIEQAIADLRETYRELEEQRVAKAAKLARETPAPAAQTADTAIEAAASPAAKQEEGVAPPSVAAEIPEKVMVFPATAQTEPVTETEAPVEMASEPDAEETAEAEIPPEQAARVKLQKLSADVQPGAWFIVYNGENRPVRRLKLAVILMQDATLVFVDHLGNVVIEKDAEEFAAELERGASGVIMQHSVFDHALRSALTSIQH